MKKRIITGFVALILLVPVLYFSYTIAFPITVGLLSTIAVYEMAKCVGYDKRISLCLPLYICSLGLPILRFFTGSNMPFMALSVMVFFAVLIYFLIYNLITKNSERIFDLMNFFSLSLYVIGCFLSILLVRYKAGGEYEYLLIFIGAWICDTFAYFVGKLIGKHKLIPEISPKKTIEGSIGGIVFTILAYIIYGIIINKYYNHFIPLWALAIMGLVVSIISQFGDLIASSIKRQYEIKDFGFVFPGHGGVLDRFDSVMLVAPCLYVLLEIFN